MVQGQGMTLERRVPICLGGVPGVPGFGKEAQVGKAQVFDYLGLLTEQGQAALRHEMRPEENPCQEQNPSPDKQQEAVGFSQGPISSRSERLDRL
jgi:hypothetical protein